MHRREFLHGASALGVLAPSGCASAPRLDSTRFHAGRRFAETAFGRIAYFERGQGEVALFLHGFPLNGFQWRGAIERLSASRRCIAPDFLGLGYTEVAPGQDLAPRQQAAMLSGLLDELGVEKADIIANDSGGAVAQLFVAHYPERARTLLLTNCDVEFDCPPPALQPVIELARAGRFAREWLVPWLADKALARSAEGIGGLCYSLPGHPTDEALEYYLTPLVRTPQAEARTNAYAVALERNALAGIGEVLRRIATPMRVVWGVADPIFSPESPDYLNQTFPNARGVRRLEGAKLFFPEEHPDIIAGEATALWGH